MTRSHVFALTIGSLFAMSAPVFSQSTPSSTGAESMGPSTTIPGMISVPGMPSSVWPSGSTGFTSSRSSLESELNVHGFESGSSSFNALPSPTVSPGSHGPGKTGGAEERLGSSGLGANAGAGGGGMGSIGRNR